MKNPQPSMLQQATQACHRAFYVAGFFSLFINMLMLAIPLHMLQVYDRVLPSRSTNTLIYLTAIAIAALLVLAFLDMARSRILVNSGIWFDHVMSPAAFAKSPDEILKGRSYGPQALRDIATVKQFISGAGIIALFDAPWAPIYLIAVFMLHPLLGVIALVGAMLLFALAILNEMVTREPLKSANAEGIASQRFVESCLRNAEAIQAMGMMSYLVNHWTKKNEPVLGFHAVASNRSSIIMSASKFLRLSLQILMLAAGAMLVIHDVLTAGAMIAASILMARALAPVEQSIAVWKQFQTTQESYGHLKQHFSEDTPRTSGITLPRPKGAVSLENVSLYLPNIEKPIINQVSFKIEPGQLVAVIGPSGAGKTTLARLLVGALKPSMGHVRLDGAEVYDWDRNDFGQYVGYLPQDVELFPGTVTDNIARMNHINDEAVLAAAQIAGIHEIVLRLRQGYSTPIGENHSSSLSGGQRQRIALARALYNAPSLIILDEPNSNLDAEGEEALLRALLHMREKGATQVIVSHRSALIKHVDQIILMNEGKVQLMGERDSVLASLEKLAQSRLQSSSLQGHA
jgi:PrtD family type I secretion system ABC transporter